jgi:hypothetical protein
MKSRSKKSTKKLGHNDFEATDGQLIAVSWQRVSTKTVQNCCAHCSFKHSDLQMLNTADSENDVTLEMHHIGKL